MFFVFIKLFIPSYSHAIEFTSVTYYFLYVIPITKEFIGMVQSAHGTWR